MEQVIRERGGERERGEGGGRGRGKERGREGGREEGRKGGRGEGEREREDVLFSFGVLMQGLGHGINAGANYL